MKYLKFFFSAFIVFTLASCADEPFDPQSTDIRTEISKEWNVVENNGEQSFSCTVSKVPTSENQVVITNFHKMASVTATVYSDRTISVPNQTLAGTTTGLKNCTGTISSTYQKIDWTYTITDPQDGDFQVTASFSPGTISKKKKIQ
jgi:hypothetical protein